MRALGISLLLLALAGCTAQPKSSASSDKAATRQSDGAVTAAAPQSIDELTNQTLVYECPKCGMDYDRAGTCSMDGATLVAMKVSYVCPADGKPVKRAGHCPRCQMNARIDKTALATGTSATTGN